MITDPQLSPGDFSGPLRRLFQTAAAKCAALETGWDQDAGAPVFTINGKYAARGWTQWTDGFHYGLSILAFDATGDRKLLDQARRNIVTRMSDHLTHMGVHDHAFNNLSTYGNLRRLIREGRIEHHEWELNFYELAIKTSGAVQAARWARSADGGGYIYSFNGPHSLFIDTMRTVRILGLAHTLGQTLLAENDLRVSLLSRLIQHGQTTARYNIYYGQGRDSYDVPALRGRTAHEAIFNPTDGQFRCPSSQQGYSARTTWTRGLAWAILGFAEQLEFLGQISEGDFTSAGVSKSECLAVFENAARATADFYVGQAAAADGVPYWDTGAPGLVNLGDWKTRPADPFSDHEPVDSSAAAIAAQGLIRLGRYLGTAGKSYLDAGLTIARTLLADPYLCTDQHHQGLLLHSVYHRPNGWDYIPPGAKIPRGESSMWGDYHLLELGVLIARMSEGRYLTFFDSPSNAAS
ncbi:MAG: glycosyl hydrolase [Tepidisphaeraceae bacterium]